MRGLDVLTAAEDGTSRFTVSDLLDRATALERVLFTRDDDLLAEATMRQRQDGFFYGVIFAHQLRVPIGVCIQDLELIALASTPSDAMSGDLSAITVRGFEDVTDEDAD